MKKSERTAPSLESDAKLSVKSAKSVKSGTVSTLDYEVEEFIYPRTVTLTVMLKGQNPWQPLDLNFFIYFNGQLIVETNWDHEFEFEVPLYYLDLKDKVYKEVVAEKPLLFFVRTISKTSKFKEIDPLAHTDNKAGGTLDLYPLLIGEDEVYIKVRLYTKDTGEYSGLKVLAQAVATEEIDQVYFPLTITMVSAHCLPPVKDNTYYVAAIGIDEVLDKITVNFGLSLSSQDAKKVVWADVSTGGKMANSAYSIPDEDKYVPPGFDPIDNPCNSVYWNAFKRVVVYDQKILRERLKRPIYIEIAGVPFGGKIDVRGRFMGMIDAQALLEPGQESLMVTTRLRYYSEQELPILQSTGRQQAPLLMLPPTSAKASGRAGDFVTDEAGHTTYAVIHFSLTEALNKKPTLAELYVSLGLSVPLEKYLVPQEVLHMEPEPESPIVDVRKIRKEEGALQVHNELCGLACKGTVPMNLGIKRTAANKLMGRIRTMLKEFAPGECSQLAWQETVTAQHAATRRAVTSSFQPQPPPPKLAPITSASRCRMAFDNFLADHHLASDLEVSPSHPRVLLAKALQLLEARTDSEAKKYIRQGLEAEVRSKFVLWTYGGIEFYKGEECLQNAIQAFRIACKGKHSDGTANAIAFAALHAACHYNEKFYGSFVAAKKMRKSYFEMPTDWSLFVERWVETSGQEEVFWAPKVIRDDSPLLIAAAFFLCLRCYNFSEQILKCLENGCGVRGSRLKIKNKITPDVFYLRAASFLLRRHLDMAMQTVVSGVARFGPCAILSQIRASILMAERGWDNDCEFALLDADRAGAEVCPSLLLASAKADLANDAALALQRAARAHKIAPCAHTALTIGRCYAKMGDFTTTERWAAVAVKAEPLLSDGWAELALLAMRQRNVERARAMLRIAHQGCPLSQDMLYQLAKMMHIVKIETLSDSMLKNLCFCDYLPSVK